MEKEAFRLFRVAVLLIEHGLNAEEFFGYLKTYSLKLGGPGPVNQGSIMVLNNREGVPISLEVRKGIERFGLEESDISKRQGPPGGHAFFRFLEKRFEMREEKFIFKNLKLPAWAEGVGNIPFSPREEKLIFSIAKSNYRNVFAKELPFPAISQEIADRFLLFLAEGLEKPQTTMSKAAIYEKFDGFLKEYLTEEDAILAKIDETLGGEAQRNNAKTALKSEKAEWEQAFYGLRNKMLFARGEEPLLRFERLVPHEAKEIPLKELFGIYEDFSTSLSFKGVRPEEYGIFLRKNGDEAEKPFVTIQGGKRRWIPVRTKPGTALISFLVQDDQVSVSTEMEDGIFIAQIPEFFKIVIPPDQSSKSQAAAPLSIPQPTPLVDSISAAQSSGALTVARGTEKVVVTTTPLAQGSAEKKSALSGIKLVKRKGPVKKASQGLSRPKHKVFIKGGETRPEARLDTKKELTQWRSFRWFVGYFIGKNELEAALGKPDETEIIRLLLQHGKFVKAMKVSTGALSGIGLGAAVSLFLAFRVSLERAALPVFWFELSTFSFAAVGVVSAFVLISGLLNNILMRSELKKTDRWTTGLMRSWKAQFEEREDQKFPDHRFAAEEIPLLALCSRRQLETSEFEKLLDSLVEFKQRKIISSMARRLEVVLRTPKPGKNEEFDPAASQPEEFAWRQEKAQEALSKVPANDSSQFENFEKQKLRALVRREALAVILREQPAYKNISRSVVKFAENPSVNPADNVADNFDQLLKKLFEHNQAAIIASISKNIEEKLAATKTSESPNSQELRRRQGFIAALGSILDDPLEAGDFLKNLPEDFIYKIAKIGRAEKRDAVSSLKILHDSLVKEWGIFMADHNENPKAETKDGDLAMETVFYYTRSKDLTRVRVSWRENGSLAIHSEKTTDFEHASDPDFSGQIIFQPGVVEIKYGYHPSTVRVSPQQNIKSYILSFENDPLEGIPPQISLDQNGALVVMLSAPLIEEMKKAFGLEAGLTLPDAVQYFQKYFPLNGIRFELFQKDTAIRTRSSPIRPESRERKEKNVSGISEPEATMLARKWQDKGLGFSDFERLAQQIEDSFKNDRDPFETSFLPVEKQRKLLEDLQHLPEIGGPLIVFNLDVRRERLESAQNILRQIAAIMEKSVRLKEAEQALMNEQAPWTSLLTLTVKTATLYDILNGYEREIFERLSVKTIHETEVFLSQPVIATSEQKQRYDVYYSLWYELNRFGASVLFKKFPGMDQLLKGLAEDAFQDYLKNPNISYEAIFSFEAFQVYLERALKTKAKTVFPSNTDLIWGYQYEDDRDGNPRLVVINRGWFRYSDKTVDKAWADLMGGESWDKLLASTNRVFKEDGITGEKWGKHAVSDLKNHGLRVGLESFFQVITFKPVDGRKLKSAERPMDDSLAGAIAALTKGYAVIGEKPAAPVLIAGIQNAQNDPVVFDNIMKTIRGLPPGVVMTCVAFLAPHLLDRIKDRDPGYFANLKGIMENKNYRDLFAAGSKMHIHKLDPQGSFFAITRIAGNKRLTAFGSFLSKPFEFEPGDPKRGKAWSRVMDLEEIGIQNSSKEYLVKDLLGKENFGLRSGNSFFFSNGLSGWHFGVRVGEGASHAQIVETHDIEEAVSGLRGEVTTLFGKRGLHYHVTHNGLTILIHPPQYQALDGQATQSTLLEVLKNFKEIIPELNGRITLNPEAVKLDLSFIEGKEGEVRPESRNPAIFDAMGISVKTPQEYADYSKKHEKGIRRVMNEIMDGIVPLLAHVFNLVELLIPAVAQVPSVQKIHAEAAKRVLGITSDTGYGFILGLDLALGEGKGMLALAKTIYPESSFVILVKDPKEVPNVEKILLQESLQKRVFVVTDAKSARAKISKPGLSIKGMISSDELMLADELEEELNDKPIIVDEGMRKRFLNAAGQLFQALADKIAAQFVLLRSA